jgi:formate-dependent nitrite reductase membrane component NrfD
MGAELTWGMPVILYLFLAGVGAGAVTVSSSVLLRGGGGGFGGGHVLELGRPFRALNLFKVINLSPMSVGSWLVLLFIWTSLFYALAFLPSFLPQLKRFSDRLAPLRGALAWINVPLGIGVAVYTGILLGAMPSRPLWNSPILALLFMISALSTGVATIILARTIFHRKSSEPAIERQFHDSAYLLTATDVMLIGFELMVIFLFVMFAHLTVGNVKYAVSIILPGGDMALMFWVWVVLIGLLLPALVELVFVTPKLLYHRDYAAPRMIEIAVSVSVLIGGFMLRYVVVVAGQITGPMGL